MKSQMDVVGSLVFDMMMFGGVGVWQEWKKLRAFKVAYHVHLARSED